MTFEEFSGLFESNFRELTTGISHVFEVDVDKDELWNVYLEAFPEGTNEIYRERREYDCGNCRSFIKTAGNIVVINENDLRTVWGFETGSEVFQPVVDALDAYVKSHVVSNVWVSKIKKIGVSKNFEYRDSGELKEWNHFHVELPKLLVDKSKKSEAEIRGSFRDTYHVFKRSLEEITEDSVRTVLELIAQNSLYKGEEWKGALTTFLSHKNKYDSLMTEKERTNYAWEYSVDVGSAVGRIRNHSMGTLLVNLSEGMDLDTAVSKYEAIVAPTNYKRPKAIYSKKMLEDAKNTVIELGYGDSLERRFATLDDIRVNNILFSNRDAVKRIKESDVFAEMAQEVPINPKKFSRVEEISVDKFIEDVLPQAHEVSVLLENKHAGNMVSLISPEKLDAPSMFKWNNGFSWAYTGNITDSLMKDRVKSAGGNVDGVLRFSIQWNDRGSYDGNDLDAHCIEPNGYEIYYVNKRISSPTGGILDVDIINPSQGVPAVENITWENTYSMREGKYRFFVRCYSQNGGRGGFRAEIEFDGQLYEFDYEQALKGQENVAVAEITYRKDSGFSINEKLPSRYSSRDVWGVKTNQFVPVSVVMYSPNYWDDQSGIGNRHVFFMLKDCVNPENPNGFFNEYLKEDLLKHKRVFEALGGKMAVKDNPDQLSGVGFSTTKRNDIFVKVKGQVERVLKVKF